MKVEVEVKVEGKVEGKEEKGITGKVGQWEESASARKEEEGGKSCKEFQLSASTRETIEPL